MKNICAFKIAVEHIKENTFGSIILRPKSKITSFAVVKEIGFMAKKMFPELNVNDTVVVDFDGSREVDGLCIVSPFEIVVKIEDGKPKVFKSYDLSK